MTTRQPPPFVDMGAEEGRLVAACRCHGSIRLVHDKCLSHWLSYKGLQTCELCGYKFRYRELVDPGTPSFLSPYELLAGWLEQDNWQFRLLIWAVLLSIVLPIIITLFISYTSPLVFRFNELSSLPWICFCGFLFILFAALAFCGGFVFSFIAVEAGDFFSWWRIQSAQSQMTEQQSGSDSGQNEAFEYVVRSTDSQRLYDAFNETERGDSNGVVLINGKIKSESLMQDSSDHPTDIDRTLTHHESNTLTNTCATNLEEEEEEESSHDSSVFERPNPPTIDRISMTVDSCSGDPMSESHTPENAAFSIRDKHLQDCADTAATHPPSDELDGSDEETKEEFVWGDSPDETEHYNDQVDASDSPRSDDVGSLSAEFEPQALQGSRPNSEIPTPLQSPSAAPEETSDMVDISSSESLNLNTEPALSEFTGSAGDGVYASQTLESVLSRNSRSGNQAADETIPMGDTARGDDLFEFFGLKGSYWRIVVGCLLFATTAMCGSGLLIRLRYYSGQRYVRLFMENQIGKVLEMDVMANRLVEAHLAKSLAPFDCEVNDCGDWTGFKLAATNIPIQSPFELTECPGSSDLNGLREPLIYEMDYDYVPQLQNYNLDLYKLKGNARFNKLPVLQLQPNWLEASNSTTELQTIKMAPISHLSTVKLVRPCKSPVANLDCGVLDMAVLGASDVQTWIAGMASTKIRIYLVGYTERKENGISYNVRLVPQDIPLGFAAWFVGMKILLWTGAHHGAVLFTVCLMPVTYSILSGLFILFVVRRRAQSRRLIQFVQSRIVKCKDLMTQWLDLLTRRSRTIAFVLEARRRAVNWLMQTSVMNALISAHKTFFQILLFICCFEEWAYLSAIVAALHLLIPTMVGRAFICTLGYFLSDRPETVVKIFESNQFASLLASLFCGKLIVVVTSVVVLTIVSVRKHWSRFILDHYVCLGFVACAFYSCQKFSFSQVAEFNDDPDEEDRDEEGGEPQFTKAFPHACRAFFSVSTWDCIVYGLLNLLMVNVLVAVGMSFIAGRLLSRSKSLFNLFVMPHHHYGIDFSFSSYLVRLVVKCASTLNYKGNATAQDFTALVGICGALVLVLIFFKRLRNVVVPQAKLEEVITRLCKSFSLCRTFFESEQEVSRSSLIQRASGCIGGIIPLGMYVWVWRAYRNLPIPQNWEVNEISIRIWPQLKKIYLSADDVAGVEYIGGIRLVQERRLNPHNFTVAGVFVTRFPNGADVQFQVCLPKEFVPNHEIGYVKFAASKIFTLFEGSPVPHTARGFYLTEEDGKFTFRYTIAKAPKQPETAVTSLGSKDSFAYLVSWCILTLVGGVASAVAIDIPRILGGLILHSSGGSAVSHLAFSPRHLIQEGYDLELANTVNFPTWVEWCVGVTALACLWRVLKSLRTHCRHWRSLGKSAIAMGLSITPHILSPLLYGYLFDRYVLVGSNWSIFRWLLLGLIPHYLRWCMITFFDMSVYFHPLVLIPSFPRTLLYANRFATLLSANEYHLVDANVLVGSGWYIYYHTLEHVAIMGPLIALELCGVSSPQLNITLIALFYGMHLLIKSLKRYHSVAWKKKYVRKRELLVYDVSA